MTREGLERIARRAIDEAIYPGSLATGHFLQGIWLFRVPGGLDDAGEPIGERLIEAVAIEIANDVGKLKQSGAFARKSVSERKPDFTIIATHSAKVRSKAEAYALIDDPHKKSDREAYGFYVQAPGIDPVVLYHGFDNNSNGEVELDGDPILVPDEKFVVNDSGLMDLDPWAEYTEEDQRVAAGNGMIGIPGTAFTAEKLGVADLWPKKDKRVLN